MIPTACNNPDLNVLIVDDDSESVRILLEIFAQRFIRGTVATDHQRALNYADDRIWNMALIDSDFAGGVGSSSSRRIVSRLKANHPEMPVVMLTRSHSAKDAPLAAQTGYSKVLVKPLIVECVEELLNTFAPNHETEAIARSDRDSSCPYAIVGSDPSLKRTVELAGRVAPTSAPVMITGESGTGKELIAQLIHAESRRSDGPFIKVNCAALNDSLLESELFGHEKGAFTGAGNRHEGRFERAHGGTLLLDEITETEPQFQAKLLRVLESMNFERVGGNEDVSVNVRVISTTNTDILSEVEKKRFRADLYHRLSVIKLAVPPLRRRRGDVIPLVWLFLNQFAHEAGRPITSIDTDTLEIFEKYHWPGNVRQLRNVVRTALIFGTGPALSISDAPWLIDEMQTAQNADSSGWRGLAGQRLEEVERRTILATLEQTDGNQTRAAKALGISDRTLRDKIKKYRSSDRLITAE